MMKVPDAVSNCCLRCVSFLFVSVLILYGYPLKKFGQNYWFWGSVFVVTVAKAVFHSGFPGLILSRPFSLFVSMLSATFWGGPALVEFIRNKIDNPPEMSIYNAIRFGDVVLACIFVVMVRSFENCFDSHEPKCKAQSPDESVVIEVQTK